MTHNKYHGSGRRYSEMEMEDRAAAFERQYFYEGYHGRKEFAANGLQIMEPTVRPYRRGRV